MTDHKISTSFSIGSPNLPGLSKLVEEMGEVQQVVGKIMGLGHAGDHWDGTNLKDRLEEELADNMAAICFVAAANDLDLDKILARSVAKQDTYGRWHINVLAGRDPYDDGDKS